MLKFPCMRVLSLSPKFSYCNRSVTTSEKIIELDSVGIEDAVLEEDTVDKQLEIDKKRNKSRLSAAHFNLEHGLPPYSEPMHKAHYTTVYQRKLYGKFGAASNVDPRICWMDKEELASKLEYDSLAEEFTIPQMIQMANEKKMLEKKKIAEREALLEARVAKISAWANDLKMRQEKALAVANAAKEKKERLVEEVRRHFGFKVDPRDDRFKEMLAEKEKQQKKQEKLAKKSAREAKLLATIQQQSAEISKKD